MVFIDGSNLFWALQRINIKIDFYKLVTLLVGERFLVRPYYYSATSVPPSSKQIRFFQALKHQGFTVITKPLTSRKFRNQEFFVEKGVDIALVKDLLVSAFRDLYDVAILVSGDNDYASVIDEIKRLGKKIEVVAFDFAIGAQLRNVADKVVILENLQDKILLTR